jgi:hypothetical protein
MWRGLPNTIAGTAANNKHLLVGCVDIPYWLQPRMDWTLRAHETFHSKYQYYSFERTILSQCTLMLGSVIM